MDHLKCQLVMFLLRFRGLKTWQPIASGEGSREIHVVTWGRGKVAIVALERRVGESDWLGACKRTMKNASLQLLHLFCQPKRCNPRLRSAQQENQIWINLADVVVLLNWLINWHEWHDAILNVDRKTVSWKWTLQCVVGRSMVISTGLEHSHDYDQIFFLRHARSWWKGLHVRWSTNSSGAAERPHDISVQLHGIPHFDSPSATLLHCHFFVGCVGLHGLLHALRILLPNIAYISKWTHRGQKFSLLRNWICLLTLPSTFAHVIHRKFDFPVSCIQGLVLGPEFKSLVSTYSPSHATTVECRMLQTWAVDKQPRGGWPTKGCIKPTARNWKKSHKILRRHELKRTSTSWDRIWVKRLKVHEQAKEGRDRIIKGEQNSKTRLSWIQNKSYPLRSAFGGEATKYINEHEIEEMACVAMRWRKETPTQFKIGMRWQQIWNNTTHHISRYARTHTETLQAKMKRCSGSGNKELIASTCH